jgi:histone H3/H4
MIVNRTKIKEIVGVMQVTKEFCDELDKYVEETIKKACKRASANNRRSVMARDI